MKKSELQTIIREEIKNAMAEVAAPSRAFKNWKVTFNDNGTYGGVKTPKKGHVETVKARNTAEAIRKAATKVGLKAWWHSIDIDVKLA